MRPSPSLRLHHVGYAVKEIDEIASSYVNSFGYEVATPIIHDPLQTALVQFLKLAADAVYLEFVAPDSPESKLSTAVRKGGKLNHLCYTCGPFEKTIPLLEASDLRLISPPMPGVAFAGRRICWFIGEDLIPVEFVERQGEEDACAPGVIE